MCVEGGTHHTLPLFCTTQYVGLMYGINDDWSALQIKTVLIAGHADGIGAASLHLYTREIECRGVLISAIHNFQQGRQCTYIAILRGFRATAVAMGSITYSECVFIAVGIQHAMRMRHFVICDLSGCTIFYHIISYMLRFSKRMLRNTKYVLIFSTNVCLKYFSF